MNDTEYWSFQSLHEQTWMVFISKTTILDRCGTMNLCLNAGDYDNNMYKERLPVTLGHQLT